MTAQRAAAEERIARVAATLDAAERAHAAVSARTGGADPEWPLFYAWWLINWSDLPDLLGATPTRSRLVYELVRLDRTAPDGNDVPWSRRYAAELLALDWS